MSILKCQILAIINEISKIILNDEDYGILNYSRVLFSNEKIMFCTSKLWYFLVTLNIFLFHCRIGFDYMFELLVIFFFHSLISKHDKSVIFGVEVQCWNQEF